MERSGWLAILVAGLVLAGCEQQPSRETIGTGAGAVIGGVVGSEVGDGTAGTVIGGAVGALLGREIARRMDANDRQRALSAVETNTTETWTNPDTGARYTVRPTETFRQDGRLCREYTSEVRMGDERERVVGTACKSADGTWEVVNRG